MTESEKLLFKRALWDATCSAYLKELDSCEEDACFSAAHAEKMNVILGAKPARTQAIGRPKKRTVIATIIAAALLFVGCAVYVYREVIGDFIVTVFKDHINISFDNSDGADHPQKIEEKYTLGYVPEGYTPTKTSSSSIGKEQQWKNNSGEYIIFEQSIIDGSIYNINSELGETKILHICGLNVYYRNIEKPCCIWSDGKYSLLLTTSEELPLEELEKIIQSIETE